MSSEKTKTIGEQIADEILFPLKQTFDARGITPDYLAKKLKRELNAKETKQIKMKGNVRQEDLPKKFKVIGVSETVRMDSVNGDGPQEIEGTGESLVMWDVVNWSVRQKARIDAHKLRGDYPAEKHEHTGPGGKDLDWRIEIIAPDSKT